MGDLSSLVESKSCWKANHPSLREKEVEKRDTSLPHERKLRNHPFTERGVRGGRPPSSCRREQEWWGASTLFSTSPLGGWPRASALFSTISSGRMASSSERMEIGNLSSLVESKSGGKANHPFSARKGGREEGPLTSRWEKDEESSLL